MTQKEFFATTQTDNLLKMRFQKMCYHPVNEGDKPDYYDSDSGSAFCIDKKLLYNELSKRPHRIRAKDRRKKNKK